MTPYASTTSCWAGEHAAPSKWARFTQPSASILPGGVEPCAGVERAGEELQGLDDLLVGDGSAWVGAWTLLREAQGLVVRGMPLGAACSTETVADGPRPIRNWRT